MATSEEVPITGLDMTIGEFSMVTGLSPKALRLYDERGLLRPAAVDPASGYRWYSSQQIRHGAILGALRQGNVPLAELADVDAFDFEGFRDRREVARLLEDTALKMALAYRSIALVDWPVRAVPAPAQPWVATRVEIRMADDADLAATFLPLIGVFEQHCAAVRACLDTRGDATGDPCWTTAGRSVVSEAGSSVEIHVCVPAAQDQRDLDWDGLVDRLREVLDDPALPVAGGVLPARLEIRCTEPADGDQQTAMASDVASRLAVDAYIRDHGHRPLGPSVRHLIAEPDETYTSVVVRDVVLPAGEHV